MDIFGQMLINFIYKRTIAAQKKAEECKDILKKFMTSYSSYVEYSCDEDDKDDLIHTFKFCNAQDIPVCIVYLSDKDFDNGLEILANHLKDYMSKNKPPVKTEGNVILFPTFNLKR